MFMFMFISNIRPGQNGVEQSTGLEILQKPGTDFELAVGGDIFLIYEP
jgi:hypothetical protein